MSGKGGRGASTEKLVGFANFKRHNPRSDRFEMIDFDHLEFWCSDATNTALRFSGALGMPVVASSDVEIGNHKYTSICLQSDTIRFVFTAPFYTDVSPPTKKFVDSFPFFNAATVETFIKRHGVAVRAIGLQVKNATEAHKQCVAHGGQSCQSPVSLSDENGKMTYSEVLYYEDVCLRFVEGRSSFKGSFLPGFQQKDLKKQQTFGLHRVDHVVSNVPILTQVSEHLNKMIGFHEFAEFTAEDVGTVDSGLNSMVMANNEETILLPINEPTFGTPRQSQIQTFLDHHRGPGVQHIAIATPNIFNTMQKMNDVMGGVEFLDSPGDDYYKKHVPEKMGSMVTKEMIARCQSLNILIDRDEEGGLLQIFTKPLLDRPTLFIEIIQRLGCELPNGKQKPACGGFGKGNFGALFKSIEDYERKRDEGTPVKK